MIIGVDVDGVVIEDIGMQWLEYLWQRYPVKDYLNFNLGKLPYDLTMLFTIPLGEDGFEFWRNPNLYTGLQPSLECREKIIKLKEDGHKIIFISQAKGWHHKSKYYFLDKWFPFKDGVVFTKEKHLVNVDVMIDDSVSQLDKFDSKVLTLQFRKDFIQPTGKREHRVVYNWNEVYDWVKYLEGGEEW
jgi:5'(3')-deoxyribonucleotidase